MTRPLAWAWPLALAGASGWLIFRLWAALGLPATGIPGDAPFPGLWQWFFALWLPALFPAFTLAHALLEHRARTDATGAAVLQRAGRWDRRSYWLLPLFLGLLVVGARLGHWRMPFAAVFVGTLFAKVLLLLVTLYRGVILGPDGDGLGNPRGVRVPLFLVAFLCYAFLTPYVITAISTAGDEHVYLLNTESLYRDGGDLGRTIDRRAYDQFYWGRPAPASWGIKFVGFPALLVPGYALGSILLPHYPLAGRLGATLTIGLFAALLGVEAYRLCRDLGASRPSAVWAWGVVALTPPVLVNSGHVYPELPAAWAALVGVRALLRIPARAWAGLLTIAAAALFMVALKDRYASLGVGLLLWALIRLALRRALVTLALLVALTAAGLWVLVANPVPSLFPNLVAFVRFRDTLTAWNGWMPVALLGLVADQEFGLLYFCPHWSLAFVGVALFWRRHRGVAAGLLALVLFYLGVLVKYRWNQWDAGWTPPPRFILVVAPLLTPFVAEVFERCRGRALAAVNTLWWLWSGTVAFVLSLVPFWRYNGLTGRSTLLRLAGAALGLDLARFLPSLRAPTAWTWAILALGALALLTAALLSVWSRAPTAEGWGAGAVLVGPARAGGLALGLGLLWLAAAALVPTGSVQAEAMEHTGGIQFGSYQDQAILWVMKQEGELSERIVTWPGVTEIRVIAGGYTTTGIAPRMTLFLDDRPVQTWTLRAGAGDWIEDAYVAVVPTGFGHPRLRLGFTQLLDHRGTGHLQHAYVDRLLFRRVAGPTG